MSCAQLRNVDHNERSNARQKAFKQPMAARGSIVESLWRQWRRPCRSRAFLRASSIRFDHTDWVVLCFALLALFFAPRHALTKEYREVTQSAARKKQGIVRCAGSVGTDHHHQHRTRIRLPTPATLHIIGFSLPFSLPPPAQRNQTPLPLFANWDERYDMHLPRSAAHCAIPPIPVDSLNKCGSK